MATTARQLASLALTLACSALCGCDDVVLYDVASDGRLLVASDADGRTAAVGDGRVARHLFTFDPVTGELARLTSEPAALAWPRACGRGAVYVEGGHRLMHLDGGAPRLLFRSPRRLYQPAVARDGTLVSVLEADRMGTPGTLHVLEVASARVVGTVEDALLGAAWAERDLLVGRATEPRARPFESGPGEIVRVRGSREVVLVRGDLPAVVQIAAAGDDAVCAVHLDGPQSPLGLVRVRRDQPGAVRGEAAGVCDFWPSTDPASGRVLFTRARPEQPTLEGELRLASLAGLDASAQVPTPGPVAAPRFVGDGQVAFLTRNDHLVIQDLDGRNRLDLSERLRAAYAQEDPQ